MKRLFIYIFPCMLGLYCFPMVESFAETDVNANDIYDALMGAYSAPMLDNVVLKCQALPVENQEEVLALCLKKMDNHEKVTFDESIITDTHDLSVVCGRCIWFMSRVLNVQLPKIDTHTSQKEIMADKKMVLEAIKEWRKEMVPTIYELTEEPLDKRLALAGADNINPNLLAVLSEDTNDSVRLTVATNNKTPPSVLIKLASSDFNADVRKAAMENLETARTAIPPKGTKQ